MSSSSSLSLSLSSSSSLVISRILHQNKHKDKSKKVTTFITIQPSNSSKVVVFRCALVLASVPSTRSSSCSSSSSSSSSSSRNNSVEKKRRWKVGEYPAISKASIPRGGGSSWKKERAPMKNIKKKLDRKSSAKAWANTVTEALSDTILKKQWLQALQVFEMLKEQSFYQPKEGTYMKLLILLGKSGQPQLAHQLFDTMLEEGLEPTSELYTALLAAYSRNNLIACVDASQFELVESLYEQMAEQLITPNTVTQNIVLSGYGKAGKLNQMEKVLSGMLESPTSKPDVWTMNTILSLFGIKGQIEMMERWYEKFHDFGIEPETCTFNILIGAYGKKRMYGKMSSVMEYMRKLSFPWTMSTYNNVIEVFSEAGDVKHMEYTFNQMLAEGVKADTKTFCCLIRGYANSGIFHKVISTVQLARKLEILENTTFCNAAIFACAKAEDLMEMERVFERMKDKQNQPDSTTAVQKKKNKKKDSTTYSIMVDAYRKEGISDMAYDLEQENSQFMVLKLAKVLKWGF